MSDTMKAIVKTRPAPGLELISNPLPQIGPQDVLVKVLAASLCGTDMHIYEWNDWAQQRIRPPLVVGHEIHGEVVDRGALVTKPAVGARVSLESHVVCNVCQYCRTGRSHICEHTQIIGVDRDGGFAEYIAIPAQNTWVVPDDMPIEIAVLLENFGNAVHTAMWANISAKKVLITGCGPVGTMAVAVARATGAQAIYYRLEAARRMGADLTVNGHDDVVSIIREATHGEGVDVVLEMSGAPSALDQAFSLLKPGGQAVLLGLAPGPYTFDMNNHVIFKGASVHGVVGRRLWETWFQADSLLRTHAVDLTSVVTHRVKMDNFDEAYQIMLSGQSEKVVLRP